MIKLIYYRHNQNFNQSEITKQKISFNELTIVLKGQLNYVVNGQRVNVLAGDVIYIHSGSERYRELSTEADYVSFNFFSDIDLELPVLLKNGVSDVVYHIIATFDLINKYTTNLVDERFTLLLSCLLKQFKVQRIIQAEPPLVSQIKNYIKINLDKKITLVDVSEYTHYSISHCEMIFNKITGLSITAYVIKKRIEKAQLLLIEKVLTLQEVAEAVGFTDYNYFSRTFKKEMGVSPLTYRNTYFL